MNQPLDPKYDVADFWDFVAHTAAEVRAWPRWKREQIRAVLDADIGPSAASDAAWGLGPADET